MLPQSSRWLINRSVSKSRLWRWNVLQKPGAPGRGGAHGIRRSMKPEQTNLRSLQSKPSKINQLRILEEPRFLLQFGTLNSSFSTKRSKTVVACKKEECEITCCCRCRGARYRSRGRSICVIAHLFICSLFFSPFVGVVGVSVWCTRCSWWCWWGRITPLLYTVYYISIGTMISLFKKTCWIILGPDFI